MQRLAFGMICRFPHSSRTCSELATSKVSRRHLHKGYLIRFQGAEARPFLKIKTTDQNLFLQIKREDIVEIGMHLPVTGNLEYS